MHSQVPPLLDALTKNSSLTRLNLADSGLEWDGPESRPERSGMALIEAMHEDARCLAALKRLIVGRAPSGATFTIPVARLRAGGEQALGTLREGKGLLQPGGPRRVEILLMAELLRKHRRTTAVKASEVEASASSVMALLEEIKGGRVTASEWALRLTALIADGLTRRSHLKTLLSAETLRAIGFTPTALLAADYSAAELKEGGYTAAALRDEAGFANRALRDLGFSAADLRAAGLTAVEMGALTFTAAQCRQGGYAAAGALLHRRASWRRTCR